MEFILNKCDKIGIEDVTATHHKGHLLGKGFTFILVLTFDHEDDLNIFIKCYPKLIQNIEPIPYDISFDEHGL